MTTSGVFCALTLALAPICVAQAQLSNPAAKDKIVDARTGDVRVLATGSIIEPLEAIRQQAQSAVGRRLAIEYGSARGNLRQMVLDGQGCEVTLLLPDVDVELTKASKLEGEPVRIASVPVALGVRGNPPKLDVSTKDGLRSALVNASLVFYGRTGAARDTVDNIFDKLNVRSMIRDGTEMRSGETTIAYGPGEYQIGIFPLSEILASKSYTNLGPVIAELQIPVLIEASICKSAVERAAAKALVDYLLTPAFDTPLQRVGMSR